MRWHVPDFHRRQSARVVADVHDLVEPHELEDAQHRRSRRQDDHAAPERCDLIVRLHHGADSRRLGERESAEVQLKFSARAIERAVHGTFEGGSAGDVQLPNDEQGASGPVAVELRLQRPSAIAELQCFPSACRSPCDPCLRGRGRWLWAPASCLTRHAKCMVQRGDLEEGAVGCNTHPSSWWPGSTNDAARRTTSTSASRRGLFSSPDRSHAGA